MMLTYKIIHGFPLAETMEKTPGAIRIPTAAAVAPPPPTVLPGGVTLPVDDGGNGTGSTPGPYADVGSYPAALLLAFTFVHVVSDDKQVALRVIGETLNDLPVPDTASPHALTAARALFNMSRPQREDLQAYAKPLVEMCTQLVREMPAAPPEDVGEDAEVEWLMHNVERDDWLQAFRPPRVPAWPRLPIARCRGAGC